MNSAPSDTLTTPMILHHCFACGGEGVREGSVCEACEGHGVWGAWRGRVFFTSLPRTLRGDGFYHLWSLSHLLVRSLMRLAIPATIVAWAASIIWALSQHEQLSALWNPFWLLDLTYGLSLFLLFTFYYRVVGQYPSRTLQAILVDQHPLPILTSEDWADWQRVKAALPKRAQIDVMSQLHPTTRACFRLMVARVLRRRQAEMGPHELLDAMLSRPTIRQAALRLNIDVKDIHAFNEAKASEGDRRRGNIVQVKKELAPLLILAVPEAVAFGHSYLRLRDLWVSFAAHDESYQQFFRLQKIHVDELRHVVDWMDREDRKRQWWAGINIHQFRQAGKLDRGWATGWTVTLDKYSTDLTIEARKGLLHSSVIREATVAEMATILGRSHKSNVLLIGDPGIGKSTLIKGLALRIVTGEVPDTLRNKRLVRLNIGALVGAGQNAAAFSQLMTTLLEEVIKSKNVILVLDNIHQLRGVGREGDSGLDAYAMLEPALLRNDFQAIATTTYSDYLRFMESSESFSRCFVQVKLEEPTYEQTVQILEESVLDFEQKQHVVVTYQAIKQAILLGKKYIHDHVMPEVAVDLLDEASVAARKKPAPHHVDAEDIGAVVSMKTGIPISEISLDEGDQLLKLESIMHERLIGQAEAVTAVSNAVRRARVGLKDTNRPVASFLFVGSTGVGKTELAKALAEAYFGHEKMMIRIDMSEYKETSAINRLIGVPEKADSGTLVQAVRQKPHSLVLLDEFEKAHPDIHNLFLQVFDDGRLTSGSGRVVDFTNTILIATSNAGAKMIQDGILQGRPLEAISDDLVRLVLPQTFKPELINRFDDIIVFKPLSKAEVFEIGRRLLSQLRDKLAVQDVTFKITEEAIQALSELGYDPAFGARSLRRVIQDRVENPIARRLLKNEVRRGDTIVIRASDIMTGTSG